MKYLTMIMLLLFASVAYAQEANPSPAGNRLLNIDISYAEGEDYVDLFLEMCELGLNSIKLSLDWTDIETSPNNYDNENPAIANVFYPVFNTPVEMMIRPVHTGTLRVPDDLANLPLDDSQVIERFNTMLDWVLGQMPDTMIGSLSIGSEIDVYLGTNQQAWAQYENFAIAVRDHLKANYPDIPIAFEMIYNSLLDENTADYAQSLNQYADVIGVSYYPLQADFSPYPIDHISQIFDALVATYPDKPIYIYQIGYPSSDILSSSEAQQAEFIEAVFREWDTYSEQIVMISFTWLTDLNDETVRFFEDYYSFRSERFAAFLGSIGLRYSDGRDKQARHTLEAEALARNWSNNCI